MASFRKTAKTITFDKPSSWWGAKWREGIPLGNGITGACVNGGAGLDTIMLTSVNSLWQGNISVLPDVSNKIRDVRKLIEQKKYKEAENVIPDALISKNYRPQTAFPLPICDFKIKMPLEKFPKEYSRALNMETGEAAVMYRDGATKYERKMFVSRENDMFIMEITKYGSGTINAQFSFDLHDRSCARTPGGILSKLPEFVTVNYQPYFMFFSARKDNGTEFGAVARVSYYGGTQEVKDNCLCVKGAGSVLVIIKLFTESQREKEWKNIKTELAANKLNYDKMFKLHSNIHSKLFGSAEIDLRPDDREQSAEQLLADTQNSKSALFERLWQMGRYLFISSAREDGSLIVYPYGLWCGDYKAVKAYPDFSGKTQNMYRFAFDNNLCDMVLPLLSYFENVIADLKKNAQRLYNCRGIFIPASVCDGTGLLGSVNPQDIHYVCGAAEIANMFFDYYCYCRNKKFLKERAMPFMKEAMTFFEDFLVPDKNGYYTSYPSYSPQNCPGNLYEKDSSVMVKIAKDSEVDFASVRKLIDNLLEGSEICGLYKEQKEIWLGMRSKLPQPKIAENSAFVHNYNCDELTENFKEGYMHSLYGVFPYHQKEFVEDAEISRAYLNSVKKRVSEGMNTLKCHTLAYLASAAARLGAAETAAELISHAAKSCVMDNFVTADNDWRDMGVTDNENWAAYQISGNIALCGAITSLFVYSYQNRIYILPSEQQFKNGSIKGILTACGVEVDIIWDVKKGIKLNLKAKQNCKADIVLPQHCRRIVKGPVTVMDENKVIKDVELGGGKLVTFEIKT
jgi:alpha-L-fucosidase 2